MRAAWYEHCGPAAEVLQVGEMEAPIPGPGDVRVRILVSAVNNHDTNQRSGRFGAAMPHPRVVPHSDGAGVVESVGEGVDPSRVGRRVWVYGAQAGGPFGTAAELAVVPSRQAVYLPDSVSDEVGACLGLPGITAHRAIYADGPVLGKTVLVQGVLGAVGALAAQMAKWGGARVIGSVRRTEEVAAAEKLPKFPLNAVVALDDPDPTGVILAHAPDGVDRIVEVSLSANAELDATVLKDFGVLAAYASETERAAIPFWPMAFGNVIIRFLGSDGFPSSATAEAAEDLAAAAVDQALSLPIEDPLPLAKIVEAHDKVEAGGTGRVLVKVSS